MRGPVAHVLGIALAAAGASAVSATAVSAAPAERYEDGISAYQRNDFDKSIKTLRPLAERGDARAQYMLGRHYQFGQGVKMDRAEAFFWYRRAEAKGHLEAKLFRQLLEKRANLTADEKSRGERRLAELNAPKARPEKPKVETAVAREPVREPERPAITSRPSEPPVSETARTDLPEKTPPKPVVAARSPLPSPPVKNDAERSEANRAPTRRPATEDDDETETADAPAYRPNPPPVETRTAIAPPAPNYPAGEIDRPAYAPPNYTQPNYAQPNYPPPGYGPPGYAQPGYPSYSTSYAPPYYAPAAPPTWRPRAYYAPPQAYYAPAWGYRPRGYWQPGWRGAAAWGPGRGFGRYRGR